MVGLFEILEKASALFVKEQYTEVVPLLERSSPPIRTTSMPRCASPPRTRRSGTRRKRSPRSRRLRQSHRSRPTSGRISRCTTRAERTGSRPCLCWSTSSPRRPSDCRRSKHWPCCASVRAGLRTRSPCGRRLQRRGRRPQQISCVSDSWRCSCSRRRWPLNHSRSARALNPAAFAHDLELGVLYLAARRFSDARDALDRIPPSASGLSDGAIQTRPGQRAAEGAGQRGADRAGARRKADRTTRELIERERLFQ